MTGGPPGGGLRAAFAAGWVAAAIGTAALIVYVGAPTRRHGYDALVFAEHVERGRPMDLFHPHHLAYPSIGRVWLTARRDADPAVTAAEAMLEQNAWIGAVGVALLVWMTRHSGVPLALAAGAGAGLAVSWAYWNSATEISARGIACVALEVTALAALWAARGGVARWFVPGAALGLAGLAHQTNVLFSVFVAGIAVTGAGGGARRRAAAVVIALATGAAVSLGGYWLAGRGALRIHQLHHLVTWGSMYLQPSQSVARHSGNTRDAFRNTLERRLYPSARMTPAERIRWGWAHAFLAGWDPARRDARAPGEAAARTVAGGAALLVAGGLLAGLAGRAPFPRPAAAAGGWWLAGLVPFFAWWEPGNVQFWVTSLPGVWWLIAAGWTGLRGAVRADGAAPVWRAAVTLTGWAAIGVIGWSNFTGRVAADAAPGRSIVYEIAGALHEAGGPRDALLVSGLTSPPLGGAVAVTRLSADEIMAPARGAGAPAALARLHDRLAAERAAGCRLLALPEALFPGARLRRFLLARYGITATAWDGVFSGCDPRPLDRSRAVYDLRWPRAR